MPKILKQAGELYTAYCVAVGGRGFNGQELPTWDEFRKDPSKQKQVAGWIAVAEKALQTAQ